MAAGSVSTSFVATDRFLRRIRFSNMIRNDGVLRPGAFTGGKTETAPSWTLQDESLRTEGALDKYQAYWQSEDGGRPGLFWVSYRGFTECLQPPLPPSRCPDAADLRYGHLHCTTEVPTRKQCEILAKIVQDGDEGAILRYVLPPPPAPAD